MQADAVAQGVITPDDTIARMMQLFQTTQYHRLFLVDSHTTRRVIGVVALRDVLHLFYRSGQAPEAKGRLALAMKRRREGKLPGGEDEMPGDEEEEPYDEEDEYVRDGIPALAHSQV
jgi:CBS domain-containing protein